MTHPILAAARPTNWPALPLPILSLICAGLGLALGLMVHVWLNIQDLHTAPHGPVWALIFVPLALFSLIILLAHRSRQTLSMALGFAAVLTGLTWLYMARYAPNQGFSDTHQSQAIALAFLLTLPFAFLPLSIKHWTRPESITLALVGLVRQIVVMVLALGLFWAFYLFTAMLFSLVNQGFLLDALETPRPALIMSCMVAAAILPAAIHSRVLIIGFDALFYLSRWLAPVFALILSGLALIALINLAGLSSGGDEDFSIAAISALSLSVIPLLGAAIRREGEDEGLSRWLHISLIVLITASLILALASLWWTLQNIRSEGLIPMRVFSLGLQLMVLAGALIYASTFIQGRAGLQRGAWTLTIALIGWCALSMTPLINAQALSAHSQSKRLRVGASIHISRWDVQNSWGLAGQQLHQHMVDMDFWQSSATDIASYDDLQFDKLRLDLNRIEQRVMILTPGHEAATWFSPNGLEKGRSATNASYAFDDLAELCEYWACFAHAFDWLPDQPGLELLVFAEKGRTSRIALVIRQPNKIDLARSAEQLEQGGIIQDGGALARQLRHATFRPIPSAPRIGAFQLQFDQAPDLTIRPN